MAVSKDKGNRGEVIVRDYLRKATGLNFEKTPASGAMAIQGLKGDLFIPASANLWTVEVKNYEEDGFGSLALLGKGELSRWWQQVKDASKVNKNNPMLIYKWNRSKLYCVLPRSYLVGSTNKIEHSDYAIYVLEELDLKKLFGVT